jgi:outer membrane immunogenic protein
MRTSAAGGRFTGASSSQFGEIDAGGIETRLFGNWTAKAEYLHLDLGSTTNSLAVTELLYTSFSVRSSFRDDIFRAGLNYKVDVN